MDKLKEYVTIDLPSLIFLIIFLISIIIGFFKRKRLFPKIKIILNNVINFFSKLKAFFLTSNMKIENKILIHIYPISIDCPVRINLNTLFPYIEINFNIENKNPMNLFLDRMIINISLIEFTYTENRLQSITQFCPQGLILERYNIPGNKFKNEFKKKIEFRYYLQEQEFQFFRTQKKSRITFKIDIIAYFYSKFRMTLLRRDFEISKEFTEVKSSLVK